MSFGTMTPERKVASTLYLTSAFIVLDALHRLFAMLAPTFSLWTVAHQVRAPWPKGYFEIVKFWVAKLASTFGWSVTNTYWRLGLSFLHAAALLVFGVLLLSRLPFVQKAMCLLAAATVLITAASLLHYLKFLGGHAIIEMGYNMFMYSLVLWVLTRHATAKLFTNANEQIV